MKIGDKKKRFLRSYFIGECPIKVTIAVIEENAPVDSGVVFLATLNPGEITS